MPTFLGRRTPLARVLPVHFSDRAGDDEGALASATEMFAMIQDSNHATAFAGWVVATCAIGLTVEAGTIRSASHSPVGPLLLAGLLPLVGAAARIVVLLVRAGGVASAAQEDFHRFIATTAPGTPEFPAVTWRRLRELTVAARRREKLTRRALTWAYATGTAFLAWSAAITTIAGSR